MENPDDDQMSHPSSSAVSYEAIRSFWSQRDGSLAAAYMIGHPLPSSAARIRFRMETEAVLRMINGVQPAARVLDLGCGSGHWSEFFARRCQEVVAVEASPSFYEAACRRCASLRNVTCIHADVRDVPLWGSFDLVFIGGVLMYLADADVIVLLRRIASVVSPGARVVCRESTDGIGPGFVSHGYYQAMYRSPAAYKQLFAEAGYALQHVEINAGYIVVVDAGKLASLVPAPRWFRRRRWFSETVGRAAVYWSQLTNRHRSWQYDRRPSGVPAGKSVHANHFFVIGLETA